MIGDSTFGRDHLNRLAKEMRRGNRKAAEAIYQKLVKKVFGFCVSRVGNRALAEDLTQDIFLKLIDKIDLYDDKKGDFVVWFWQIARNTLIDHYRREKPLSFADLEDESEVENIPARKPLTEFNRKSEKEYFEKLLSVLNDEEQEIFRLRFINELSYKEMSGILGKNEGALRVSINRIRKKLKPIQKL